MCKCKSKVSMAVDYSIGPDDYCPICADKHFSTAMQAAAEIGYEDVNRNMIVGELELARKHLAQIANLAEQIRQIRHLVQYRKEKQIGALWLDVCRHINSLITAELSKNKGNKNKGKVYVLGNNVASGSLKLTPEDRIIFLGNKPSVSDYKNNVKIRYHAQEEMPLAGCFNYYLSGKLKNIYPPDFVESLKKEYDWNYEAAVKEMSLAYIVVKHMARIYPAERIVLVNLPAELPVTAHVDFEKKYFLTYTQITTENALP